MRSRFFIILILYLCIAVQAQIPAGAVAGYPFCGNANDAIGSNNGSVLGATLTADRFGNPNRAYYFNGQPGCYIDLGTSNTLKPVKGSVSVWARPDGFSYAGSGYYLNPVILTKNQPGNNCYEGYSIGFTMVNGPRFDGVITQPFCNQSYAYYAGAIAYQSWYHLVLAWSIDSIKLYVNGVLAQVRPKGFNNVYLAGDSVMVGNTANVQNNRFFLGAIDDIYIYPHELSYAEVMQLYNAGDPCSVGMDEETSGLSIGIFPNPLSEGQLSVSGIPAGACGEFRIFNMEGDLVLQHAVTSSLDAGELPAGVYLFMYTEKDASTVKKLVVIK